MAVTSLRALIASILAIDPTDLTEASGMNATENWDSLQQFQVMTAIEQTLAIRLPFDVMEHAASIAEIRVAIAAAGGAVAD